MKNINVRELLSDLYLKEIFVWVTGNDLELAVSDDDVFDEYVDRIRALKTDIVDYLIDHHVESVV